MVITSTKNETVKRLRSLAAKNARRESGLHLAEGERLVFDALVSGARPEIVLVEQGAENIEKRLEALGVSFVSAARNVLEAVSDTKTPQGIAAAFKTPDCTPPKAYPKGLIAALDALQDPGNLGTIIRTADAMGASAIILGAGCTDAFSPKALRAAMGSTYHIKIFEAELAPALLNLKNEGRVCICGHLRGEAALYETGESPVIVIGNEANGVSNEVASLCTLYKIPMYGRAESLNASVAASILLYEAAKRLHGG